MSRLEIVAGNLQKGTQEIYHLVPSILRALLNEYPQLDGFVIGGSYASGSYKNGEDVDMDLLFSSHPENHKRQQIEADILSRFQLNRLKADIRAPHATDDMSEVMRKSMYKCHPQTPFVVRNQLVAHAWGLI